MKKLLSILILALAFLSYKNTEAQCAVDAGPQKNFCCPGFSDTIHATFFDTICPCPNRIYQWTPTSGLSNPNVLNPVVTATTSKWYKLCVTIPKKQFCSLGICCQACDSVYINVTGFCCKTTGLNNEGLADGDVKVFPNPTNHTLNVQIAHPLNNADLLIFDSAGKEVYRRKDPYKNTEPINVSQLAKGLYLVKIIENGAEVYNTKVMVE